MHEAPFISVLLPAHNQEENLRRLIPELNEVLESLVLQYEIIVIDAGSSDRTLEISSELGADSFTQTNPGYGQAVREGINKARGNYIVVMESDGSYSPQTIKELWNKREQAQVITASPLISDNKKSVPLSERLINKAFVKVLRLPLKDATSRFRLYSRATLTPERYTSSKSDITQEMLVRAYAKGYSVAEVSISYSSKAKSKAGLYRQVRNSLSTLYRMWVLRNSVESCDYDHRAYDSLIPLQRYWQRRRYVLIRKYLEGEESILDIGCGSSRIIQSLPGAVAMDVAIRKVRFLQKTNSKRVCASTFHLPFKDHSFSQAIHSQVIEHIPLDKNIYRELNRVMKPDGNLIIGTPDYGRIWWPITEYFYGLLMPNAYADEHITHYTKESLTEILEEHGFKVLSHIYICAGELIFKAKKVAEL